jgi:hypothetical protein
LCIKFNLISERTYSTVNLIYYIDKKYILSMTTQQKLFY